MPFQVRSAANPQDAVDNWEKGVRNNGDKLATNYATPRRNPRTEAVAQTGKWLINVTAAHDLYTKNVGNYSEDGAIDSMNKNGKSRYVAAATSKKPNVAKTLPKVIAALRTIAAGLPADRSTPAARDARALQQIQKARELRGQNRKTSA